ncbi:MAG: hypothetical protein LUB59_06485, partial [Candidatus Gastranaerophilales bacterium]|nr:hypothetical protein [Candidatus Gastranaerophilales bacterium]
FYNYYEDYQYDSCISKGICSINPRTSSLREVLVMYLKQLAFFTLQLKYLGVKNNATEDIILNTLSGLMSNLETGNKQFYQTLVNLKTIILESVETYNRICSERNITPKKIQSDIKLHKNLNITELIRQGEQEFSRKLKSVSDEKRNLYEILFLVLKSICINLVELKSFNINYDCAYNEILYLLNTLNYPELSTQIILKKINKAVEADYYLYTKLYETRKEKYGEQTSAEVSYTTRPNKAILVAGTNIQELKNILDAAKDKDIDVYTHGEMIVAYTYPKFREYQHLRGQFGKGIEHCLLDFATFPGAILIARHSLENIEYLYRGRLFTTDNFIPQGVIKISNNDYTPLIESALAARGFKHGKIRESITIGCSENDLSEKMNSLIQNIKDYKNIIIIGTEEQTKEQKLYFDNLLKHAENDTVVISLSEKHNVENFIHIKSAPDFYMIYRIFEKIKTHAVQNNVKITLFLSKCNKHTISNILNLKRLGLDNIYLSKCTPIMLNPTLTQTLKDIYEIRATGAVSDDKNIFD